jgi:hypothetical protein
MVVADLDADAAETWGYIAGRSYAFTAYSHALANLRNLSIKDLRKFYQQYVASSTDTGMSMRARLVVQVVVADLDAASDISTSQTLTDHLCEGPERKHAHGSRPHASLLEPETHGKTRHSHSGGGSRHRSGGGRVSGGGGAPDGTLWCCAEVRVSFTDTGGDSLVSSAPPSGSALPRGEGGTRIEDVEKWKAAQFVCPKAVGALPR